MNKNLTRKQAFAIVAAIIGIPLFFALIAAGSTSGDASSQDSSSISGSNATTQAACATSLSDLKKQATTVSYKDLQKDPTSYNGQVATFTGQVLQIQQQGNDGVIRLSVTDLGDGIWSPNDVVYVTYHGATPVVNDDVVHITGVLNGTQTYTSQANYQITLPSMDTCGSDIEEATSDTNNTTSITNTTNTASPSHITTTTSVNTTSGSPSTWHTAYQTSGTVQTQTPPFALKGTEQRISFSCSVQDSSIYNLFNATITATQGFAGDNFATVESCPISNTTYEYLAAGEYYLTIDSTNARFNITVEDYY